MSACAVHLLQLYICNSSIDLLIMERKFCLKMKEAEKLSFGEKGSLPPLMRVVIS
jgi:hypothetical protein